jgi:transforming growth factor-beta-induced protein
MTALRSNWLNALFCALALAFAGIGCDDDPVETDAGPADGGPAGPVTISGFVAANAGDGDDEFGTLFLALSTAPAIDPTALPNLAGDGPFTVFAPTNAAFDGLIASLGLTDNPDALTILAPLLPTILQYHIVEGGAVTPSDNTPVITRSGFPVFPSVDGGSVTINGGSASSFTFAGVEGVDAIVDITFTGADVTLSTDDTQVSNGIIHVVNSVLVPPDVRRIVEYAIAAGLPFNDLAGGLVGTETIGATEFNPLGLLPTSETDPTPINPPSPITVFAPTDDAFAATGDGIVGADLTPAEAGIILYHVVAGTVTSDALPALAANTVSLVNAGTDDEYALTLLFDGTAINGGAAGAGADINTSLVDLRALNGVVHVIDRVLLPLSITDMAVNTAALSILASAVRESDPIPADLLGGTGDPVPVATALTGPEPAITVFAPINPAFEADGLSSAGIEGGTPDPATLLLVLGQHVLPDVVLSGDLAGITETVPSLTAVDLTIAGDATAGFTVTSANGTNVANIGAGVGGVDIGASNGVVHLLDAVLGLGE